MTSSGKAPFDGSYCTSVWIFVFVSFFVHFLPNSFPSCYCCFTPAPPPPTPSSTICAALLVSLFGNHFCFCSAKAFFRVVFLGSPSFWLRISTFSRASTWTLHSNFLQASMTSKPTATAANVTHLQCHPCVHSSVCRSFLGISVIASSSHHVWLVLNQCCTWVHTNEHIHFTLCVVVTHFHSRCRHHHRRYRRRRFMWWHFWCVCFYRVDDRANRGRPMHFSLHFVCICLKWRCSMFLFVCVCALVSVPNEVSVCLYVCVACFTVLCFCAFSHR